MSQKLIKHLESKTKEELLLILQDLMKTKDLNEYIQLNYCTSGTERVKLLKKTFNKYLRRTRFHDYRETISFFDELNLEVLTPLSNAIPDSPEESATLIQYIIDSFDKLVAAKDDSSGCAWEFNNQLVVLWGNAWSSISNRDTQELIQILLKYKSVVLYSASELIFAFKDALGKSGLSVLESYLADDKEALLYTVELQSDPDKYRQTLNSLNVSNIPVYQIKLSKMLLDVFREEEAIDILRIIPDNSLDDKMFVDKNKLLIEALTIDGKSQDAQIVRWSLFTRTMSPKYYQEYIKHTSTDEIEIASLKARELALSHGIFDLTLQFFEELDDYGTLGKIIPENLERLSSYSYSYYRKLSKKLATHAEYLAAVLLRRTLVEDLLAKGASKYYDYAASDLKLAMEFGDQVTNWGNSLDNEAHITLLQMKHGKKYSFWDRLL